MVTFESSLACLEDQNDPNRQRCAMGLCVHMRVCIRMHVFVHMRMCVYVWMGQVAVP